MLHIPLSPGCLSLISVVHLCKVFHTRQAGERKRDALWNVLRGLELFSVPDRSVQPLSRTRHQSTCLICSALTQGLQTCQMLTMSVFLSRLQPLRCWVFRHFHFYRNSSSRQSGIDNNHTFWIFFHKVEVIIIFAMSKWNNVANFQEMWHFVGWNVCFFLTVSLKFMLIKQKVALVEINLARMFDI